MPTVIAFANMKGGVGKTTLCVNLAFELFSSKRKRVLVVDNDPQFNATSGLLHPERYIEQCIKSDEQPTIYDIYEKPPRVGRGSRKKPKPSKFFMKRWWITRTDIALDLIPSRLELYETLRNPSQKEYLLDKFLTKNASQYDYIFIDCPPTPSVLTLSAFAASDFVLIPVTPDYLASVGLPQFLATLSEFKADLVDNHNVRPLGVIFTNVPRKSTQNTQWAINEVASTLGDIPGSPPIFSSILSHWAVLQKTIWQSVPVQKITGHGLSGKSAAVRELRAIASELENMLRDERESE